MSANGLHQIQWRRVVLTRVHRTRRVSVCETLRKYYGNVEHVEGSGKCRQTDSIGPDGDGLLDKSPSDAPLVSLRPHGLKCDECYMSSALASPHDFKNDECYMCSALVSPHGLKNDECYMCSTLVSRHGSKNDECYMRSALGSPHGSKNDECYMHSALVSRHGSKNDECYMCSALVSRHGFKNDVHFICSALVLPHGFKNEVCFMCSTLFRLTAERYFLCLSRTDLRGVRSTLARTNCLYRARSSLFANIFNSPRCC